MERKGIHPTQFFSGAQLSGTAGALYGLLAALVILLLCSFLASGAVYLTSLPESAFTVMAVIINIISLFVGGYIAGRKGKNRGLLRGLVVGGAVLLLMLAFGALSLSQLALKAGYCLPAAALGGICGVK